MPHFCKICMSIDDKYGIKDFSMYAGVIDNSCELRVELI